MTKLVPRRTELALRATMCDESTVPLAHHAHNIAAVVFDARLRSVRLNLERARARERAQ